MSEPSLPEESIFARAIEIEPAAERAAFLDRACGDNPALRAEVEALLRASRRAGDVLDLPDDPAATTDPPGGEQPGTAVGPYKLLELIGEGGMGAVWMAEQTEPIHRRVAVKVVKAGMDSKQVLARFEAERQALALMDHPNIAKVLDAGTAPSGRPYFVMELVKGQPITTYCDEKRLGVRDRLDLFGDVCRAVQHAHQKGIIHRDLKPSNVLVAPYDGRPVVKVIDFGVAKATGRRLTDRTLFTGFGAVVGTPEYMSPEQAEVNNQDIDTRSDVYSLGVLLYELLTGSTPLTRKRVKEVALLEVLRVIREEEPPRPSTRLSESTESLPSISALRQTEPARLTKLVRGELDWIVMKALEKDRTRRYETANGFAIDVQRYLADEAVAAGPPSAAYRVRTFVRRHRGPVLAAGVFVGLLAVGVAGTTTGLVRAVAAQKRVVHERDAKEQARRDARQALDTMTDEVVGELLERQAKLTDQHRAFLHKVLAYYEAFAAETGDDPEARRGRADGAFRVGRIHFALGEFQEAEDAYREALALREHLAADFPDRPELRADVAESHNFLGHQMVASGRPKEAEKAYREAVALRKRLASDAPDRPEFHKELADSLTNLGVVLRNSVRPKEAESAYREALAVSKQLASDFPHRPEFRKGLADVHFTLGELLSAVHRKEESEAAYREALAVRKQLAADFPNRAEARQDLAANQIQLGVILRSMGRPKEAEAAYNDAIATAKRQAAEFPARPDFRYVLVGAYQNLGALLGEIGRPEEALAACRAGLALSKRLAADFPDRPDFRGQLALAQTSVGNALAASNRLDEAEPLQRDALTLFKGLAGDLPSHTEYRQHVVQVQIRLGDLLRDTSRPREAEAAYRDAVAVGRKLAADFPDRPEFRHELARGLVRLGDLLDIDDRPAEAETAFRDALARLKSLPDDDPEYGKDRALIHYKLGCAIGRLHRPDEAAAEYREAIRFKDDYPQAHTNLGSILLDRGDADDAITEFRSALATKEDFPDACKAHNGQANALRRKGRPEDAIAEYREAIRLNKDFAEPHFGLGNVYYPDRLDDAIAEYRAAVGIKKDYPEAHTNLGNSLGLRGDLDGAGAEFRAALATKQEFPEAGNAHHGLGRVLLEQGKLADAVAEFRAAVRLTKNDAKELAQLHEAEQLFRLDQRLPAVLQGKDQPKDAGERLAFARLCQASFHEQYAAAARLFGEAFAAEPKRSDDLQTSDRYNAACAAALAAGGRGKDADKLKDDQRALLRRQALDWLRADLSAWGRELDQTPDAAPVVAGVTQHWLDDTDLAGVRGQEALDKLPEVERRQWRKLWADVAGLRARARAKATPAKK